MVLDAPDSEFPFLMWLGGDPSTGSISALPQTWLVNDDSVILPPDDTASPREIPAGTYYVYFIEDTNGDGFLDPGADAATYYGSSTTVSTGVMTTGVDFAI